MTDIVMKPFGPKSHRFIMRRPQDDKRYTIFEGAVRSSKTFTVDAKTLVQYSNWDVPGKRLIAGVSKDSVMRNMLIDLFTIASRDSYSYNMATGELWLFGKQYFVIGARDEAAYKKILGSTVGLFIGDEIIEFPKSFLAQVFMRMSPEGARFVGTTNTGNPYCYLKSEVIDNPAFANDLEVIRLTLNDNPNISKAAKAAIIASQSGIYRLRYIDSLWVVAEGSVYRDSWNSAENTFTAADLPPALFSKNGHVDHWYSVDPGVDHVQAHLEYWDDGDIIWVTREQRWDSRKTLRQKTDGQYADDLEEFGALGCQVIVPPEAASFKAELLLRGFWVTDADNSVMEGIHTVSTLLSRRKLRVSKEGCPELCRRIPTYAWNDKASKDGEDQVLKVEDDDCDSLRYGVHGKIPNWRVMGG